MKRFLAVYIGTAAARARWDSLSAEERNRREKSGMEAWHKWVDDHKDSIVEGGAPLGKTKRIWAEGVSDIRNNLAAYTVVEAESYEAAARLFEKHPHFTIFPGDSVEIMECLPIPQM